MTEKIRDTYKKNSTSIKQLIDEVKSIIVGQDDIIKQLIIAIFSNRHLIIEGNPGLAKTLMVNTISQLIDCSFKRIQFTPDVLPGDIIGTMIYNINKNDFEVKKGPIFSNIILADEINRAPAKVQSALLEAMQEKQVTIGLNTFNLDLPFLVMATQNPIEQEGTYNLPEAQIDRFMFKVLIDFPSFDQEIEIINQQEKTRNRKIKPLINHKTFIKIQNDVEDVFLSDSIKKYIASIVFSTREPENFNLKFLKKFIEYGASPRASIDLSRSSKVVALLDNRNYVTPDDVIYVAFPTLRHRIGISFEAEAEDINTDYIIDKIISNVPLP